MPLYFVPADFDASDLDGDGTDEAWELVHAVVGFAPFPVEFEHTHEDDGETHTGTIVEGHPIVLMPVKDPGVLGGAPARAYPGRGYLFTDHDTALQAAQRELDKLLAEKITVDELERMVNGSGGAGDAPDG